MVDAGLLADARVELIDGELLYMTAKGPLHVYIASGLHERLLRALPGGWHARKEDPLVTSDTSAPEPDIAVVAGDRGLWRGRLPTGRDCRLAIEVSVSTLEYDRSKLGSYAAGEVAEVWIVDVIGRRLERYAAPDNGEYAIAQVFDEDDAVEVPILGERWSVASLLA